MRKEGEVLRKWEKPLYNPGAAKEHTTTHPGVLQGGELQATSISQQCNFLWKDQELSAKIYTLGADSLSLSLLDKPFSSVYYHSWLTGEVPNN